MRNELSSLKQDFGLLLNLGSQPSRQQRSESTTFKRDFQQAQEALNKPDIKTPASVRPDDRQGQADASRIKAAVKEPVRSDHDSRSDTEQDSNEEAAPPEAVINEAELQTRQPHVLAQSHEGQSVHLLAPEPLSPEPMVNVTPVITELPDTPMVKPPLTPAVTVTAPGLVSEEVVQQLADAKVRNQPTGQLGPTKASTEPMLPLDSQEAQNLLVAVKKSPEAGIQLKMDGQNRAVAQPLVSTATSALLNDGQWLTQGQRIETGGELGAIRAVDNRATVETLVSALANKNNPAQPAAAKLALTVPFQQPNWSQAMGEKVLWMVTRKLQSADIQLDPPELGPLHVKVSVVNDQVSVNFTSHHAMVREALDSQAVRLREFFDSLGMDLVDVDVSDQSANERQQFSEQGPSVQRQEDELEPLQVGVSYVSPYQVDHFV